MRGCIGFVSHNIRFFVWNCTALLHILHNIGLSALSKRSLYQMKSENILGFSIRMGFYDCNKLQEDLVLLMQRVQN